jgi:hypothetical protein
VAHPFRERAAASLRRVWGSFGSSTGLGADAVYTPAGGGASTDLRVMPVVKDAVIEDAFSGRTRQTGRTFEVLTHDVPARPEKGATIALLDAAGDVTETFTLTEPAVSEDRLRIVWRCATGEPE